MKAAFVLCCLVSLESAWGWGGMFNRPLPVVTDDDRTGHYYNYLKESPYAVEEPGYVSREVPSESRERMEPLQELLKKELEALDDDLCEEKKCTSNEHCCEGSICIDTKVGVTGTCMPMYGKKQGESCYMDSDCESGYLCLESYSGRQCMEPAPGTAKFGEDCHDSSDCNISAGLCCRLQRKQRQQPKKLCSYFTDPAVCIGAVAENQVKHHIEHTAEEKRESAHPDHAYLKYKK